MKFAIFELITQAKMRLQSNDRPIRVMNTLQGLTPNIPILIEIGVAECRAM